MAAPVDAADQPQGPGPPAGEDGRPASGPETVVRRWPWWLLRLLLTVQAADAFLQAVFAGRFLSGDFAMLTAHRANGIDVGILSISQIPVAILAWRIARAPGSLVAGTLALGGAAALQIFLGFARILGVHVPLGVAIITLSAWLAIWSWTHGPGDRLAPRRWEQR